MPGNYGAGITGAGFSGRVRAQAARLTRGHLAGIAASTPDRPYAAADALGAEQRPAGTAVRTEHPDADVLQVCPPDDLLPLLAQFRWRAQLGEVGP
jgi:hypothetical protein